MDPVLASAAVAPGLALGSFLNVVVARVPARESVIRPRSCCWSCGARIRWYDNVPLVSYALLRGRCRTCRVGIPLRYPVLELVTALLVAASFLTFGATPEAVLAALFCAVMVAVSAIDLEHRIVPNRIVVPAAAVALLAQTALDPSPQWALAGLGAAGFFLATAIAYPSGLGMGDVKLALLIGAMLGRVTPVALMFGLLAAFVPGVVLMARHGARARKLALPFAPFLALGALVALFAGERILDAYLALF